MGAVFVGGFNYTKGGFYLLIHCLLKKIVGLVFI